MLWPAWSDGYRRTGSQLSHMLGAWSQAILSNIRWACAQRVREPGYQNWPTDLFWLLAFAKSISIRLSQGSSHSWRHTEMLEVSWTCTNGIRGSSVIVCRLGASKVMDRTLTYHSVATKKIFFTKKFQKLVFNFFFRFRDGSFDTGLISLNSTDRSELHGQCCRLKEWGVFALCLDSDGNPIKSGWDFSKSNARNAGKTCRYRVLQLPGECSSFAFIPLTH